jgi:acid phosphatase type 7
MHWIRYRLVMRPFLLHTSATLFAITLLLPACETKAPPSSTGVEPPPEDERCTSISGISKGPWVVRVDASSAVVRWEACREGTKGGLTFELEGGADKRTSSSVETAFEVTNTYLAPFDPMAPKDEAGTYYMHEAKLEGLTKGVCYRYQLEADANSFGRFCTAGISGAQFRFLAIGDTNPGLNGITEKLLQQVLPSDFNFTVHAGDIQYYDSGLETWASWFPRMQPLLAQGPFLPAVGNHESEKPDELDQYYKRFFGGAGFDGNDHYYRFESGGIWFFSVDTEQDVQLDSTQGIWLAQSLADAAAKPGFRASIVYFHKPWVTCGDKSEDSAARMQFEPIFDANGVRLVIQAHMHGYERFDLNGRTFLTTGGGGGILDDINANMDRPTCAQRVASGAFRHGVLIDVNATTFSGTVIDEMGATRDTFSVSIMP